MNDESMEQQVLQSLKHENIIVFKRILFSISHIFIEMEKITGGTLEAFITTRFS
jgi:serine/threonine protein kinase